jgi:hypothetical protein
MKPLGVTVLVATAVVAAIGGVMVALDSNPMRRSADEIRKSVLQKTPLGVSHEAVTAVIAKEPWLPHQGYIGSKPPVEGVTHCAAQLGGYHGLLFRCEVHGYWAFDAQDRLIDVYVDKFCHGL